MTNAPNTSNLNDLFKLLSFCGATEIIFSRDSKTANEGPKFDIARLEFLTMIRSFEVVQMKIS